MAQYRVNKRSFINNGLVEEGGIVEYDGIPGSNLDPMDAAAKKAKAKAEGKKPNDGDGEFTVIDQGKNLETPFSAANPPPGDGESRRGEHTPGEVPNPMADRPADAQPEVGPTAKTPLPNAPKANGPKGNSDLA